MNIFRQGDVLLVQVEKLPNGKKSENDRDAQGRPVIAYGEKTGHSHVVELAEAKEDIAITWITVGKERYLQSQAQMLLKHDEHRTLVLPEGAYKAVQQQRYTPEEMLPSYD